MCKHFCIMEMAKPQRLWRRIRYDIESQDTPGTLYKLVKFPGNATATLNNRLQKVCDDSDAIIPLARVSKVELSQDNVRIEKIVSSPEKHDIGEPDILNKAYTNDLPIPDIEGENSAPATDLNEIKTLHKDFLLGPDIGSTKALQIWYPAERSVDSMQHAHKMSDLNNDSSTKSALISIPFNLKLTDKHHAQMVPVVPKDITWPPSWKFNQKLGSFVCVVDRIDEKNYEFKVILMAGPYTDDNDTLANLMKLFNPLYHMYGEQLKREATIKMSKTLVAKAANKFFGPQIVESCIAVWVSCQRDLSINIKKCSTVFIMNNLRSNEFDFNFKMDNWKMDYTKVNKIKAKKVNNSTKPHIMEVEELPPSVEAPPPKKFNEDDPLVEKEEHRDNSAEIKAKNEAVLQYMRAVKANNQMMYRDLRMFGPAAYGLVPMYNHVREIHTNEDHLNQLIPDFGTLKNYIPSPEEGRMKG